jgi:uncharacterized protein (TIGR00725 family)
MTRDVLDVGRGEWIAVLGGASVFDQAQIEAAYQIGVEIARCGNHLITGATTGIPHAAAIGAKRHGAIVVGISPAASVHDHVIRFGKPLDHLNLIIYSGLGAEGRGPLILRSVAGAIFVGGEMGTLNEFTSAWMIGGNVLGVLGGSGGVCNDLLALVSRTRTSWGSTVICERDPVALANRVCQESAHAHANRLEALGPESTSPRTKDVLAMIQRFEERATVTEG